MSEEKLIHIVSEEDHEKGLHLDLEVGSQLEEIKEFINEEGEILSREEVVEELGKEEVKELEKEAEDEIGQPLG